MKYLALCLTLANPVISFLYRVVIENISFNINNINIVSFTLVVTSSVGTFVYEMSQNNRQKRTRKVIYDNNNNHDNDNKEYKTNDNTGNREQMSTIVTYYLSAQRSPPLALLVSLHYLLDPFREEATPEIQVCTASLTLLSQEKLAAYEASLPQVTAWCQVITV